MKKVVGLLLTIDIGLFAVASVLFCVQGGFAGGHGRWDLAIAALGTPWVWLPWPNRLYSSDYLWLVLLPFALNSAVVAICAVWLARRARLASPRNPSRGV